MSGIINTIDIHKLCRICLTRSCSMIPINFPLNKEKEPSETPTPSVLQVIEQVMSVKLIIDDRYPSAICGMCKGLLNIAYDLNKVFNNSQNALSEHFKDTSDQESQIEEVVPVELIFGNNKYNLNDVVIVEEEEEEKHNFQGFLNNLGTTVSAMFVNKSRKSSKKINTDKQNETCQYKKMTENQGETIIEISLDDLQGSNINDLFPEHKSVDTDENGTNSTENLLNELKYQDYIDTASLRKIYRCASCDIFCANRTRLKIHLKKYHMHQAPYFCEVCGSTSFNKSNGLEVKDSPDVICCDDCGSIDTKRKIFNTRKTAIVKSHTREYLCQVCGFISKSASNARYHQQKHLGAKYQCHICSKKYYSKSNLQWHINSHTNVRNYLCTLCGKKYNYYSALVYHMRMHSNERNYVCNYCDRRFYMPSSLKRHLRTHTGIRPNMCRYCGKTFFSLGEQKRHEMIHTGQRPYKCLYCSKAFISSFNRKVHHMSHSGPHECDHCSRSFIEIDFLNQHIKNKHKHVKAST